MGRLLALFAAAAAPAAAVWDDDMQSMRLLAANATNGTQGGGVQPTPDALDKLDNATNATNATGETVKEIDLQVPGSMPLGVDDLNSTQVCTIFVAMPTTQVTASLEKNFPKATLSNVAFAGTECAKTDGGRRLAAAKSYAYNLGFSMKQSSAGTANELMASVVGDLASSVDKIKEAVAADVVAAGNSDVFKNTIQSVLSTAQLDAVTAFAKTMTADKVAVTADSIGAKLSADTDGAFKNKKQLDAAVAAEKGAGKTTTSGAFGQSVFVAVAGVLLCALA